jgi:hypothetical protein
MEVYEFFGGVDWKKYEGYTEVDDESFFRTEKPILVRKGAGGKVSFKDAAEFPVAIGSSLAGKAIMGLKPGHLGLLDKIALLSGTVEESSQPDDPMRQMLQFRLPFNRFGKGQ